MKRKVLIVEDNPQIARVLDLELSHEGFETRVAQDGEEALKISREFVPHVVLLDIMLPKLDGFAVAKKLKETLNDVGIIALTAKTKLDDKLEGFKSGMDDYVTKPFEIEEVLARVEALMNRINLGDSLEIGDVKIKPLEMRAFINDVEIFLTPTEFRLLQELMKAKGMVLSKEDLLERVWGFDGWENPNVVEVYVNYLRRKLGKASKMLKTVRGVGYAFRKD
ncbi:response regulator transcription factor [Mesoaciditoga lauensis]|uniref:response regulator transcription factor n=1 Tax=Mesoaciditoga lauensis TaxID=1495039 RepID=UPI000563FB14|nr:response regulator transcription factor [Mesoaciditoga lauensis]